MKKKYKYGAILLVCFMLGVGLSIPIFTRKEELESTPDTETVATGNPWNQVTEGWLSFKTMQPRFGNWAEPEKFDVSVTEDANTITVSTNNTFEWKFFKDTFGYNEIYHNGTILVQNEQWWLEYQQNPSTWKPRGTPYEVTYEQLAPNHVIVTRKYTDYISTDFNVTFDFLNNDRVKITLIGDIGQADTYRIRWDATGINTEHMEHNSSANHTKIWTGTDEGMVFDYEDVYQAFGNITTVKIEHQANNHKLHHYFYVGELAVGSFELDPTFGYSTPGTGCTSIKNNQKGQIGTPIDGAGTVDNVSAYLASVMDGQTGDVQCALYAYTDHSSAGAGVLIAVTEIRSISYTRVSTYTWETFNFASPPSVTNNTNYYISIIANASATDDLYMRTIGTGDKGIYENSGDKVCGTWEDPWSGETIWTGQYHLYCSYTVSAANVAPTVDYKYPVNASTGIGLTPKCKAYCNDTDAGDTLTVTWATNETGSWVNMHTNTSVVVNTEPAYTFTGFDAGGIKYWWKVFVHDGTVNVSEIYHFTTKREWKQRSQGYLTFTTPGKDWEQITQGYLTFDTADRSWEQRSQGYLTFDTVKKSWEQTNQGWLSFSTSRYWEQIDKGWLSFNTVGRGWNSIDTSYLNFNTMGKSWEQLDTGYLTFITKSTTKKWNALDKVYLTFGTSGRSQNQISKGYLSFTVSGRSWNSLDSGYLTFDIAGSNWEQVDKGYLTFTTKASTKKWNQIDNGWLKFTTKPTTKSWNQIDKGYLTFTTIARSQNQIDLGWLSFDTIGKSWEQIDLGYLTFTTPSRFWEQIDDGWLKFTTKVRSWNSISVEYLTFTTSPKIWNKVDSAYLTFTTISDWNQWESSWLSFETPAKGDVGGGTEDPEPVKPPFIRTTIETLISPQAILLWSAIFVVAFLLVYSRREKKKHKRDIIVRRVRKVPSKADVKQISDKVKALDNRMNEIVKNFKRK